VAKELCKCDRHSWSPHYQRAYHLKKKEQAFREAMIAVAQQRTILENEILHHPCTDSDDVLASLYQMNYSKRAFPVVGYRAMKADHDDPVINPVAMLRTGLTSGYRDPTEFRAQAMELTPVSKPPPLTFDRGNLKTITTQSLIFTQWDFKKRFVEAQNRIRFDTTLFNNIMWNLYNEMRHTVYLVLHILFHNR
ncbi:hypothetical protein AAG570_005678, partial [Ranatra chinensis]